ncbi:MAG: hypothetical protein GEU78_05710 [Actinobacteria bacterium]|nr:hypothetical protein [Actinomycetota bacterium]
MAWAVGPAAAPRPGRLGLVAGALSAVWGLFLLGAVVVAEPPFLHRLSEVLPMAMILLSQAALAALGRWREPGSMLAAGIVGLPLSLVSFAGAGFPYLIPSILFFIVAGRGGGPRVVQAGLALLIALAVVGAFLVMVMDPDQVCWTTQRIGPGRTETTIERSPDDGSSSVSMGPEGVAGGCSQVPSYPNGAASMALSALAVFGGGEALRRRGSEPR